MNQLVCQLEQMSVLNTEGHFVKLKFEKLSRM